MYTNTAIPLPVVGCVFALQVILLKYYVEYLVNLDETAEVNYEYWWVDFLLNFVNTINSRNFGTQEIGLWIWFWELTGTAKELEVDSMQGGNPTPTKVGVIVRCFMSSVVNMSFSSYVFCTLPIFVMTADSSIDLVKDCLAIAFIMDIDDLGQSTKLKVKGDSSGDAELAEPVGNPLSDDRPRNAE